MRSKAEVGYRKKKPAVSAGFSYLPAAVSAAAKAKAYARPAITITAAIVRPTIATAIVRSAITTAIVRPRSVAVASIARAVVTIAIVAVMPLVPALRAEVSRLLRYIGCGFRLHRVVRGVCSGAAEQRGCANCRCDK